MPEKYHLQEMATASFPKRTEKNIRAADGTLIVSYGQLTGGSALTQKLARTHGCPCLHIDLKTVAPVEAAEKIRVWIHANKIEVLNATRLSLEDGSPTTLSDNAGPLTGDVTWAWQWDLNLAASGPGSSALIGNDLHIGTVPVPAAIWLLTSGLLGLIAVSRRRA